MIDTHSHLFAEEFTEDLPAVIERAKAAGVSKVLMPNIDDTTIEAMLSVCTAYQGYCFPMIGFHPTSVDADSLFRIHEMKKIFSDGHPFIAIGEVGMDLYWDKTYLKEQQKALDIQVQWALEYHLPLVLHCREAFPELFEVMEPYKTTELSGVFHSFTGTLEEAEKVLEYSRFVFGINGVVTFKKSSLPEILTHLPLDRIVLETDSPYLAPVPFRGRRNESSYIKNVAMKLTEIYSLDFKDVDRITANNALKVFKMAE